MKPNQIIIEKAKRRKSGLNSWLALGFLTTGLTTGFALGTHAEKKQTDRAMEVAEKSINDQIQLISDNKRLAKENKNYEEYSTVAERLANSIKFYPTEPDFISSLPEDKQEEAFKRAAVEDAKEKKKFDDAMETLGIDQEDLFFLQKGIKTRE